MTDTVWENWIARSNGRVCEQCAALQGHSLIAALHATGRDRILSGFDGKSGWFSTTKGKVLRYDFCAEAIRDQSVVIHSPDTISQLASTEVSAMCAPK